MKPMDDQSVVKIYLHSVRDWLYVMRFIIRQRQNCCGKQKKQDVPVLEVRECFCGRELLHSGYIQVWICR